MKHFILTVVSASVAVAPAASAAVVAGWDFSNLTGGAGNFGPTVLAAAASDANVAVVGLTRGSGLSTPAAVNAAPHAFGAAGWDSANRAGAEANNEFISFGVTAGNGYAMSLSSIGAYNVRHNANGPIFGLWQYRVGAGSWNDIGSAISWGSTTSSAGNAQSAIDLSGIAELQGVSAGTAVSFRVMCWSANNGNGTWFLNDPGSSSGGALDFTVNGSVSIASVPAPGGVSLLGAIGLVAGARRRRG